MSSLIQQYISTQLKDFDKCLDCEFKNIDSLDNCEKIDSACHELCLLGRHIDSLTKKIATLKKTAMAQKYSLCSHTFERHFEYDDKYDICSKCGYDR